MCCEAMKIGKKFIENIQGTNESIIECTVCSNTKTIYDNFVSIPLIPHETVEQAINYYFNYESLEGFRCSECTATHSSYQLYKLDETPKILCFYINRINSESNKNQSEMLIEKTIYLTEYTKRNEKTIYELYSMINHIGNTINMGHYITVCRNENDSCWLFNDENMKQIKFQDIVLEDVLFYKKITNSKNQIKIMQEDTNISKDRITLLEEEITLEHLMGDEQNQIRSLVHEFIHIFCLEDDALTKCNILEHTIRLHTDSPIVNVRQYKRSKWESDEIDKKVAKMLKDGIVQLSTSPYNNPVLLVKEKGLDKQGKPSFRLVTDFRILNSQTIPEHMVTPLVTDLIDKVGTAKYFSVTDLSQSYLQIGLD